LIHELKCEMPLLNLGRLERSAVVANCAMNRERTLTGSNGYARELGFDVLEFLTNPRWELPVRWLDLCCGSGRALVEAAAALSQQGRAKHVRILGLDLVDTFATNPCVEMLTLREQSVERWQPTETYPLITCVHGLHYLGDKLELIAKCVRALAPQGRFVAHLDLKNLRGADGRPAGRRIVAELRKHGLNYDTRKRRITGDRPCDLLLPFQYLGADDAAGPNFTGQPAVDSYYELVKTRA